MKKNLPFLVLFLAIILAAGFTLLKSKKPVEPKKEGGEEINLKLKMENEKLKKVLFVIAPKDFRDEEYLEPRKILEEAGIGVGVASKGVTEAFGKLGAKVALDQDLAEIKVEEYEAIVFVGGPGASIYFNDQDALSLAKAAYESGKVIGAICIAPSILANAGILSGKKATAFSSEKDNLEAKGAQYTGEPVTVDGKIITARGPEAAKEFGKKLVEVLQ